MDDFDNKEKQFFNQINKFIIETNFEKKFLLVHKLKKPHFFKGYKIDQYLNQKLGCRKLKLKHTTIYSFNNLKINLNFFKLFPKQDIKEITEIHFILKKGIYLYINYKLQ